MRATSIFILAAVALIGAGLPIPAVAAIASGQVDDFEDGTLQGWGAGAANPNAPANSATGGPAGVGDNFLHLASNGSFGAGGKLVVFNSTQWAGDYLSAAVSAIQMQVNNLGATDLVLRLLLEDLAHGQSLTTLAPVNLPAGSGWTTVSFPLASSNLTGGTFNTVMGNVTALDLVHSPDVVAARSSAPRIEAQLGVTNITAVPEPATLVLLSIGVVLATVHQAASRTRSRILG